MTTLEKTSIKDWHQSVQDLPYAGPSAKESLAKLNIASIKDLVFHFPNRYLDTSKVCNISDLRTNEVVTVVGEVKQIAKKMFGRGKGLVEIVITDKTGYISAIFFNQLYMASNFEKGDKVAFAGRAEHKYGALQINSPLYDKLNKSKPLNTMAILPFHSTTSGITTKKIRSLVKSAMEYVPEDEVLPEELINDLGIVGFSEAIHQIHFPDSSDKLQSARERLIFQEFFELQLAVLLKKKKIDDFSAKPLKSCTLIDKALAELDFELTGDQKKVLSEILNDIKLAKPMNRLLLGEVGSGKTVVAFLTSLTAIDEGHQAVIMAPTEILAQQHYKSLKPLTEKLGIDIAILSSSLSEKEKQTISEKISSGEAQLVIGTHSVIQDNIDFKSLAYVVVDEQHRFGVEQRKSLSEKGTRPHTLVMTATPIPRSLALTLYGDLDVSTIKELPSGKDFAQKVKTVVCGPNKREQAYEKIRRDVANGRQAYIVCPLVDQSDKIEAKAVEDEIKLLKDDVFPDLKVESIHGKLKANEKEKIMKAYADNQINVLVATSLIEVGIDIKNATVMLIENADRFGLAQLHQLRGRVGRGEHDGVCILFAALKTDDSIKRMKAIRELKDGFSLAEADLAIRGEGQIFGLKQAGLPDLKIASLTEHFDVLRIARENAKSLLSNDGDLSKLPLLRDTIYKKYYMLLQVSGG